MKQIIALCLISPVLKNRVGQVPPSAFSSSHRPSSELSGLCGPSTYLPWVFAPRASYMSGSLAPASRHIFATQPKRYNDSGDLGEISSSLEHSAKLSGEDVPEKGRISSLLSCCHCLPCVVVNPAQEKQIQPCEVNTPKTRILKPTILLEAQAVLLPGNAPSPAQVDSRWTGRCAFNRSYTRMSEPVSTPFTTRAQQPGADIPPSCSPSPEIRSTKASVTPSTNAPEPRFS